MLGLVRLAWVQAFPLTPVEFEICSREPHVQFIQIDMTPSIVFCFGLPRMCIYTYRQKSVAFLPLRMPSGWCLLELQQMHLPGHPLRAMKLRAMSIWIDRLWGPFLRSHLKSKSFLESPKSKPASLYSSQVKPSKYLVIHCAQPARNLARQLHRIVTMSVLLVSSRIPWVPWSLHITG
jgi:hypothetical protein